MSKAPIKTLTYLVPESADVVRSRCAVELKEDTETYLVDPSLWPELASESTFSSRAFFTFMNRQGVLFSWPIRLPGFRKSKPDRAADLRGKRLTAAEIAQSLGVSLRTVFRYLCEVNPELV